MRTIKGMIIAVLLVFSLTACSSKSYTTYTLNAGKTRVLVKSYLCEDVMNDRFKPVADYLAQPPTKCAFSTLTLSANTESASIHAIYKEPTSLSINPNGTELTIAEGSETELNANVTLDVPQSYTKGEAGTITLTLNGNRLYDRKVRKINTGIYTELIVRPMTVIEKEYQTSFTDPFAILDTEFDALADPWQLKPATESITSFNGTMKLTIPDSVKTKTICLMGRLTIAHFEYIIFMYYEGQP